MKDKEHIIELVKAATVLFDWYDNDRGGFIERSWFNPDPICVEGFTLLRTAVMRLTSPDMQKRSIDLPDQLPLLPATCNLPPV